MSNLGLLIYRWVFFSVKERKTQFRFAYYPREKMKFFLIGHRGR